MTVGEWFLAGIPVAYLNCLVSAAFALPFGMLAKNLYSAFGAMAFLLAAQASAIFVTVRVCKILPFWWNLLQITPYAQIMNSMMWFTDGGIPMLLPRFETLYPLICLALLCPVIAAGAKAYARKEIVR